MFTRPLKYTVGLCCVALAIAAAPAASPSASTDLMCHTNNPAECYPRKFQATEEFQVIHDDQDLPPGLHVRMDIYSGKKEARLNIPMEGEENVLEEVTDRGVVVVEQPESEEVAQKPAMRDQVPIKAPVYESAGKIQPPKEGGSDGNLYVNAIKGLQANSVSGNEELETALADLSDLAHDIYYGVQIAENEAVIKALSEVLSTPGGDKVHLRHLAASIFSGAIQNNPTALEAMIASLSNDNTWGTSLPSKLFDHMSHEADVGIIKAELSFLSNLLKDHSTRKSFVTASMAEKLLAMLLQQNEKWDGVRVKIVQLLADNFLDEDMGADVGVWPTEVAKEDKFCSVPAQALDDGCWEYHVEKMSSKNDGWSRDFLKILKDGRAKSQMHKEL